MDCVSLCVVLVQCCKDILQTTPPSPSVSCLANLFLFVVLLFAYFWAVADGGKTGASFFFVNSQMSDGLLEVLKGFFFFYEFHLKQPI